MTLEDKMCPFCAQSTPHEREGIVGCSYCSEPAHTWDGEKITYVESMNYWEQEDE